MWGIHNIKKYIWASKGLCDCLTEIVASWIRLGAKQKNTKIQKLYIKLLF